MARSRRKKRSSLAIVEKGFRGGIEEQYGNIVWLSECMRAMGAKHNLLLCGGAVATCLDDQQQQALHIGGIEVQRVSHFKQSIIALLDRGAEVWVLEKDVASLTAPVRLIAGVQTAPSMASVCMSHDDVWFW